MSDGFYGADVAQLRHLATAMRSAGTTLQMQLSNFNAGVASTRWPGPDAEHFRQDWKSGHSRVLRDAVAFLNSAAAELGRNANEQDAASSADGLGSVWSPSGTSPGAPRPADLNGKSAAQIQAWWSGLTADQRQSLIRDYPAEAGNTNGIPFDARVEANRANAQDRIDWLNENDPEPVFNPMVMSLGYPQSFAKDHEAWEKRQSYLQKVVDGDIKLAAYDPGKNSIVEMIGDFDSGTTTAVTYVPGTLTNEASFYGGGPQEVPHRLEQSDQTGGTVVFVYKGTEFPDGDPAEAFLIEAKSDEFVADKSPVLRDFQAAVDLEKPSSSRTAAMGHSWGFRLIAGSENDGARYDKVIALSGAAMPPGWTADPESAYSSFTYPDILLTAERSGVVGENYPMKEPAFDKHAYAPPGGMDQLDMYSMENHSLIATTDAGNEEALEDVLEEIRRR
ncbi:hypothetical protein NFC73_01795 [Pseudarthrobacter sp. RMG13]|uniref:Alpha/beta hydrolase n=1 Tax=Pseudarthrobacter humi TaxID=2952523 RepID=A0ABT1LJ69_9MICC|nr:hypothetical protein [Pseudarthrobacter humi]MCP8998472.1 hypothetical protein [Pseudarthrobacter humi]